jgi:hypothetical protein
LYQFNTAPWDRKIGLENTDDVAQKSKEELIEEIVNTTLDRSEMSDLDSLLKIVKRVKDAPHLSDYRLKQDIGSPVPSSRFL